MLTFLLVLVLIWLVGYLLFRVIIPLLFANYFRKMTKNMNGNSSDNRVEKNKREGEVNIDYVPEKDKEEDKDKDDQDGEYVDFEEIE